MAYTSVDDPTILFNTILYTGNDASNRGITGVNFAPDWVWIKKRNNAAGGVISDTVRGAGKVLYSSETNAEGSESASFVSFDSDGYTISQDAGVGLNVNSHTYVGWNWKAGGSASSNSSGNITSSVSANTTAGFSIVSYTANGTNGVTVGHGLGVAPNMMIIKNRDNTGGGGTESWLVYHKSLGAHYKAGSLDGNFTSHDHPDYFNDTEPTSSVFSLGDGANGNTSGEKYIAYCFTNIKGYSMMGSYTGNGSTDGAYINLGFRPAWVMGKRTDVTNNWYMFDNKRSTFNLTDEKLRADTTATENVDSAKAIDMLSNGIKIKSSDEEFNASNGTYIFMAFAESPFTNSSGIPNNAR